MQLYLKSSFIIIRDGAAEFLGKTAADAVTGRTAVVVTDTNIAPLYLDRTLSGLTEAGFRAHVHIVEAGETAKTVDNLAKLWEIFHHSGITRSDLVIALGGGVVGDLAGFAAATYLRGCPVMQIPTSLLAQVDSSVGGKTGVNLPYGKNLAGAFHQPRVAMIDPSFLRTLPERRFSEGMAEVIKYGCIRDERLFATLEGARLDRSDAKGLNEIVERCVSIKAGIVEKDEFDTGERMILNFGHTAGHAIEKLAGYGRITHGEAVAAGMALASAIGEIHGTTPLGTTERISAVLEKYGLPVNTEFSPERIFEAMLSDKKKLSGRIHFILLGSIGRAVITPFEPDILSVLLRQAVHMTLKRICP